ncbi:MAG TPA: GerMN domain-containing protein [Ilumatobacteraceae bacterium]|jgi:hypothetical protein
MRTLRVLLLAGLLLGITACGIDDDSAPRDIAPSGRAELVDASPQGAATSSTGNSRVYLLIPGVTTDAQQLRASSRAIGNTALERLTSLIGPLTVSEVAAHLRTAIPDGLQIHSVTLQTSGTLVVDVSDQLLSLTSSALIDALAQIVFTAAEVQNVQRVDLVVDGVAKQWPAADGELRSGPLTVYDYPGFIESTQPNFPAIPSPQA